MELEQRVKSLEYEVKILKNEVQRTLLDIQEQILVHYYPSLRADESTPTEGTIQSLEAIRERRSSITSREVLPLRVPDMTGAPDPLQSSPTSPQAQQVSLGPPDPSAAFQLQKISLEKLSEEAPLGSGEKAGQDTILKLSGWVSGSVKRMGGRRTAKLIETCVDKGWIAPESMNVLLRIASLGSAEDAPETVAVNEILDSLLRLSQLLGRGGDVEGALTIIEEANLG